MFVQTHGCAIAQWQSTTGTASFRAIKAQGSLRQWKDKQHHHPGMFCGQLRKNKSLYAHGRIIVTRRWCEAIIMLQGLQTSEIPALHPRRLRLPHAHNLPTHLLLFTPLILPNYTLTMDGIWEQG